RLPRASRLLEAPQARGHGVDVHPPRQDDEGRRARLGPLRSVGQAGRMSGARSWVSGPTWGRLSVLSVVAFWWIVRSLQGKYLGEGTGFDVNLYQQYAQQWGSGAGAYVDFHPEYPPGALPIFLVPLLVGGAADYVRAFAKEMACFDLASALLVYACARLDPR